MSDTSDDSMDETNPKKNVEETSSTGTVVSTDDLFEIQKIVGHKWEGRKLLYRIRWVGYGPGDDTWEPEENLLGSTSVEMVDEYKKNKNLDTKPKKTPERLRKQPPARRKQAKKLKSTLLSDSDFESSQGTSTTKQPEFVFVEDEGEEKPSTDSAGWYGIKADESKRDLKNLFVHDRKLTQTEKLLTDIQDPNTSRLTRSQIRELRGSFSSIQTPSPVRQPKTKQTDDADKFKRSPSRESVESYSFVFTSPKAKKKKVDETSTKEKVKKDKSKKERSPKKRDKEKVVVDKNNKEKEGSNKKNLEKKDNIKKETIDQKKNNKDKKEASLPKDLEKPSGSNGVSSVGHEAAPPPKKAVPVDRKSSLFCNYRIPKGTDKLQTNGGRAVSASGVPATYGTQKLHINDNLNVIHTIDELLKDNTEIEATQKEFNDAVLAGKIKVVRGMLAANNNININWADSEGYTLLHRLAEGVCESQHTPDEMMSVLVNAGANVEVKEKKRGFTPLYLACVNRRLCHIIRLIRLCANVNTVNNAGEPLLSTTMKTLHPEYTKLLLTYGADYFAVIKPKSNLTKAQLKPVLSYSERLQSIMDKLRDGMIKNVTRYHMYTNVYQSMIFGKTECQMNFMNGVNPKTLPGERIYCIVMCAVARTVNGVTNASINGPCPVTEMVLDGRKLSIISRMNPYIYGCYVFAEHSEHTITLKLTRQTSPQILLVQVVGLFRKEQVQGNSASNSH
ncbi:unnamed protein product [Bursaphelenchus okinawaensis]|uniref:Chromo domain-containing protein n=1 Tax=Bursaphelenchus okinawaensis TaxID=465554 RepID=A0A811JRW6_9BILA|nr:unnamed protein product [Bursaphelenchus okinawaensis]CAG9080402.1 unnamed protein product [Bursaphelenchus okinawaensis]